jgi:alkanesulfonate monooxygenase SsuD/methylene tetrahydromethanopterin reductase-like flavin-dependent oxidoreductase (luciferase family)
VREARLDAGPVQQPRIPLLIGGGGERVTLRQVAQYADMSNFGPTEQTGGAATPEGVPPKYAALRRHCETLGRPYDSVLRSYYAHVVLAETPDALTAKLQRYHPAGIPADQPRSLDEAIAVFRGMAQAGVQYLIAAVRGGDLDTIRLFAERVIPALQSA